MNTGAEEESRSTPTFAFNGCCSQTPADGAAAAAVSASKLANNIRFKGARRRCIIQFAPSLKPFGDRLVLAQESSSFSQLLLQFVHRDIARNCVASQRQGRGSAGRLAHRKTGARDPRRRLTVMCHRGAAP